MNRRRKGRLKRLLGQCGRFLRLSIGNLVILGVHDTRVFLFREERFVILGVHDTRVFLFREERFVILDIQEIFVLPQESASIVLDICDILVHLGLLIGHLGVLVGSFSRVFSRVSTRALARVFRFNTNPTTE
jgi:hypothetical protein